MKCSNCLREIPDGAGFCLYCEMKQREVDPNKGRIAEIMREMESISPGITQELHRDAMNFETADDFANSILSGSCPKCGSSKTETCDEVSGIEDIFVCRCIDCTTLFCADCGQVFEEDIITVSSSECPACGSPDTNYPMESDETEYEDMDDEEESDFGILSALSSEKPENVITCNACGGHYCFSCGKPLTSTQEEQDSDGV